jgi:hypothetical protein
VTVPGRSATALWPGSVRRPCTGPPPQAPHTRERGFAGPSAVHSPAGQPLGQWRWPGCCVPRHKWPAPHAWRAGHDGHRPGRAQQPRGHGRGPVALRRLLGHTHPRVPHSLAGRPAPARPRPAPDNRADAAVGCGPGGRMGHRRRPDADRRPVSRERRQHRLRAVHVVSGKWAGPTSPSGSCGLPARARRCAASG